MTCKFCQLERPLRGSHIVPEFLYKPGYDDKHRLVKLDKNIPAKQSMQKGIRSPILCDACEQFINREYEHPVAEIWDTVIPNHPKQPEVLVTNANHDLLKLFHLSILWRAGVSSHAAFVKLSLGSKHEEEIRDMLLHHAPGPPEKYPILGHVIVNPESGKALKGTVFSPITNCTHGQNTCTFMYGGCAWHFILSSHFPEALDDQMLGAAPSFRLPVRSMKDFRPFNGMMRHNAKAILARKKRSGDPIP